MSKRILYLTYYFEPDLGAGAFRNTALAMKLAELISDHDEIHLLCTMPNRYSNLQQTALAFEKKNNIQITRVEVGRNSDSFFAQIKSFLSYRRGVIEHCKNQQYDLVFASSSKLFTAYLAYRIAKKNLTPLYVDLRDLFAENLKELVPHLYIGKILSFFIKIFFEKPCLRYASHLNLNSRGFMDEFSYINSEKISVYPNGIDDYFIGLKQNDKIAEFPLVITYAGNIGEGQGLEKIIPDMAYKLGKQYQFQIIGSGSSISKLEQRIIALNLKNVQIIKPVARNELLKYYCNSHYLFLHLNDYKSFEKVIPSKVFEYAAFDMPILAGVAGYPARFIEEEVKTNCFVFNPCDVDTAVHYLKSSSYELSARPEFVNKFRRENITNELALSILQYFKK